ncbi:hypothetical protein KQI03_03605 [Levilactobacillus brevis]|nr:hypothetical protein [Levilactobacillus brevis]MBU5273754.1 hypothetical protein [Levilactobacillus brevis]MCT3598904.1 hypothetical protein [Levilactobacillus brevis]PUD96921.1 hypothetical protein DA477_04960 [Levilactobacillus brevis]QOP52691.1 hypothetical protein HCC75_04735 [Levilactobacillus brevis]GEB75607.1 hypothetical protein LBR04_23460 [Levilactobacillus brevis]
MLKSYDLWYWGYDPDNHGQSQMLRKEVLVSETTLKRFLSRAKYDYYEFVIDDGQKWIVASDLVLQLRERVD